MQLIVSGKSVLLDDNCGLGVTDRRWRLNRSKAGAITAVVSGSVKLGTFVMLHRLIMEAPDGMVVDHISGDVMDNRQANLRLCTQAENLQNRKMHTNNRSGFKGVYRSRQVFVAEIKAGGRKYALGRFPTPELASAAYNAASQRLHGEFARQAA